jgi:rare lipoprotein A
MHAMARIGAIWFSAVLTGCSVGPGVGGDGPPPSGSVPGSTATATPRAEPKSRYGNPSSYVVFGKRYYVLDSADGFVERGVASWYGKKFHGRRTSSGETYNMHGMTAAHKSLPLPTYVEVTNLKNGRQLILRVNDRGPFHGNRIIDLSYAAAGTLGIVANGTGLVEVRVLGFAESTKATDGQTSQAPENAQAKVARAERDSIVRAEPRLFLQAGAFFGAVNAQRLRDRLLSMQAAAVSVEATLVNGQRMHRVRVGPLVDVARADRISDDIVNAGMEMPRIVIE